MPRTRREDDKKHGDKLESLIERTGGNPSSQKRSESADEEDPALAGEDADAALHEDDEDEDFQGDDMEPDRDVGERD